MIEAVLLDALGTLIELEDPAPPLVAALAAHGVVVSREQAARAIRAEIAYYRAHHDEGRDGPALAALRRRCARVLGAALPPGARALGAEAIHDALLAALRFRAFPEVPAALRELRGRGLRLVVASNWDVSLHEQLVATGLAPLVDGAVSSAEAGAGKPGPEIFRLALALAGCEPGAAAMVGDSIDTDVAGARAAGLSAVLVARDGGRSPDPAVPSVASLAELPGLLESLR